MLETLTLITGVIVVVITAIGLTRTRDPLFPLTILAPMLLYVYVYSPLTRMTSGALTTVFPDTDGLMTVHVLNLLGVLAFCIGCIWHRRPSRVDNRYNVLGRELPAQTRHRMEVLAITLGLISCSVFAFLVHYTGGWFHVFSQPKPYLRAPSGYFGEMPMLSYPAIFMLAFAYQGRRLRARHWVTLSLVMIPQIIMATLGGRRGPMFLVACSYFAAWCIIHQRRPQVRTVVVGLAIVGCLMLLLQGNRGDLFRPWQGDIDTTYIEQLWSPPVVNAGDEYVVACATVVTSSKFMHHYWGLRYFATFFIRPIPRFLWPTKYEDIGLDWMRTDPGKSGIPSSQWLDSVGFVPAGGSSGGFVADLFLEFSWGSIIICFLLGLVFSTAWRRWITRGELWTLLYFEFMILSVYLVVQSLGAWLYRVIMVTVLTTAFWRWNVRKGRATVLRVPPSRPRPLEMPALSRDAN
ncbi:MAG: oligosaccharide repeat unit polymerase [Planctomycetaceae bacterium]|nr:oligosaccharide repeat unit polymerase [Planctomycetaceae bacterium]